MTMIFQAGWLRLRIWLRSSLAFVASQKARMRQVALKTPVHGMKPSLPEVTGLPAQRRRSASRPDPIAGVQLDMEAAGPAYTPLGHQSATGSTNPPHPKRSRAGRSGRLVCLPTAGTKGVFRIICGRISTARIVGSLALSCLPESGTAWSPWVWPS